MTEELYTFSSRPRVVESGLKHKKPPHERTQCSYGNITYDRPIFRGNTYAQHINPTTAQLDPVEIQRQQAIRKKAIARKQTREQFRSRTPEAVAGRKHIDVQTDLYLEELSDIIVTKDVACVTDAFLDKPATPLFIPAKSGKDAETQIEEGDLFDFDREVQPILEVLVGKTIEQALLEVMEEEELACLKAQQRAYRELRNNELAEVQRLQEQKRRQDEEKKRRIAQQREQLKIQRETAEKIAVRAFTQEYLSGLVPAVFTSLRTQGYFNDPVETDIKTNFFPWLMDEVHKKMDEREIARQVLDTIIHDVVKKRMEKMEELETQSNGSES